MAALNAPFDRFEAIDRRRHDKRDEFQPHFWKRILIRDPVSNTLLEVLIHRVQKTLNRGVVVVPVQGVIRLSLSRCDCRCVLQVEARVMSDD
jgi:hypothetical protein